MIKNGKKSLIFYNLFCAIINFLNLTLPPLLLRVKIVSIGLLKSNILNISLVFDNKTSKNKIAFKEVIIVAMNVFSRFFFKYLKVDIIFLNRTMFLFARFYN